MAWPPMEARTNRRFGIRVGPLTITLPNPPARRRAVFFPDTNHVLTGYNTVFSEGEMVIAGFELGSGCGRYWIAWLIYLGMFGLGLLVCPRPMFAAFVRGRRALSVYRRTEDRAVLSAMTDRQFRTVVGLDGASPSADLGDGVGFAAFALIPLAVMLLLLGAMLAALRHIASGRGLG